jgi:hypothetical protein
MAPLAKLQFVGPAVLLLAVIGAEGSAAALSYAPSSEALWFVNSAVFGLFRFGDDALSAYSDMAHLQLVLVALPLFLLACCGLFFRRALPLALASNLTFGYLSFLLYAWHGQPPVQTASLGAIGSLIEPDAVTRLGFFGCALLSFAVSHILYIRDIRNEYG